MTDFTLKRSRPCFTLQATEFNQGVRLSAIVRQIGKGRFTTAYRDTSDLSVVYLAVNEQAGDYSKRILLDVSPTPYIPALSYIGRSGTASCSRLGSTLHYVLVIKVHGQSIGRLPRLGRLLGARL